MLTLTTRAYRGESDLEAIAEMLQECERADRLDEWVLLSAVRERFETPLINGIRDARLWLERDGKLVAVAQLSVPELGEAIVIFLVNKTVTKGGKSTVGSDRKKI